MNTIIGVGIGLGYAAMPALIMGAMPRSETGAANGLNTLMRAFGTTVASAVVGAILADATGSDMTGSFTTIFVMGLVAAVACAVLGFLIPHATTTRPTGGADQGADVVELRPAELVEQR